MELRDPYLNISPLDHRYYEANPGLFAQLSDYISERASVRYNTMIESALIKTHLTFAEHRHTAVALVDGGAADSHVVDDLVDRVTPAEVYAEEQRTQHNIRALVNVIKRHLPQSLAPLVHLGATSVDILDTAAACRLRDVTLNVIAPLLVELVDRLVDVAGEHRDTPQVGRTHGQYAVPITFGFAMSEYVARLGNAVERITAAARDLRGKLSGAVGAYNAMSVLYRDPCAVERHFLGLVGLAPGEHSTQIVAPEYSLRLYLEMNVAFGVIANLADDLRHLQRSEIDEVREFFGSDQVGSSTMPQKRNPWNCEHVKSLWKTFCPRIMTMFMDQVSEHQRDLTNSASARFSAEFVAGFAAAIARMNAILGGLRVNVATMAATIHRAGDNVLAEPAYIFLAAGGESDAHETLRRMTLAQEQTGGSLHAAMQQAPEVLQRLDQPVRAATGLSAEEFFARPEHYRGLARQVTESVCRQFSDRMAAVRAALPNR